MKIAVVYNRESQKVINLFGVPNREKYGLAAINRIVKALKKGGHQVIALEGDKDLIDKLEEFMPRVVKGERPGIVFNLSYGIQGQARYTHVPSILEMVGIPYVGSGPLAHSLALDKVVAKTIFRQNGLPTPDFAVLDTPNFDAPELRYPLIVKPKNEAVSLGLKIVNNEEELREAARFIFDTFQQPVLVEEYIEGREINVGILGNDPPEPFEPVEIVFGNEGPPIYTYEDKTRTSGREIVVKCPAPIPEVTALKAKEFAIRAFRALGCYDCARVDMRLDKDGNLYILELNSLPSLGEHGSYVEGAKYMGLDFAALVNRLVDVAVARYFGMPSPPKFSPKVEAPDIRIFNFLVDKREEMERGLREWITLSSRTGDPVGMGVITDKVKSILKELGLQLNRSLSLPPHAYLFETKAGLAGGTLLISHLDVPLNPVLSAEPFHIEPEWIYGEGIGVSRAPLVMTLYVLKALKKARYLDRIPLGLLLYNDEGLDCIYSADTIKEASLLSRRVLVLRPGNPEDKIIIQRRGQRIYRIVMEGKPLRPGKSSRTPEVLKVVFTALQGITELSSKKERYAISPIEIKTEAFPMLLPHRVTANLLVSYLNREYADKIEEKIREQLNIKGIFAALTLISDRPPFKERANSKALLRRLKRIAEKWDIPLNTESSLWPSVAGLVPSKIPVLCGMGPVARDLYTQKEAVQRISLIHRALLLSNLLFETVEE